MDTEFYKNLRLFLKDLLVLFPDEDENIQTITTGINLAIVDDENLEIIRKFYNAMSPLDSFILTRDNAIFNECGQFWEPGSYEQRLFMKINENWQHFTPCEQDTLWKYIEYLYGLSKIIIQRK
jgi:hypothetical protein